MACPRHTEPRAAAAGVPPRNADPNTHTHTHTHTFRLWSQKPTPGLGIAVGVFAVYLAFDAATAKKDDGHGKGGHH